jgi:hypothetical protein
MGTRHGGSRLCIGFALAFLMLVAGPAASASATAKVRLVNARAGSAALGLKVMVGSAPPPLIGPASFGQVTPYAKVPAGTGLLALTGLPGSAGTSGQATAQLADGARYTAVALAKGAKGYELKIYKDGSARAGTALLRVIHAAPELGAPNILLGKRTVAEALKFPEATPYLSVSPGSYTVAVAAPGASKPIFEKSVSLSAGVATTAILAGSGGAPERLIMVTDDTKTPAGPPETGFGGLAGEAGPPWLVIGLLALLAGALGGAAQLSLARRGRR